MSLKDKKEKLGDKTISLFDRLNDRLLYSDADWTLAQYIYSNMGNVVRMTASQLADQAYSSAGTIVRLSKALGYSGFKELKLALVKEMESSKYINQTVDFKVPFSSYSSSQDIVNSMASLYREGIDIVQSSLSSRQLDTIANKIIGTKRLFLFGRGDSMITCRSFANKLMKLNYFSIVAAENSDDDSVAHNLREGDVAMFVSYSAQEKLVQYSQLENTKKAFTIAITANGSSSLVKAANEVILIKDLEGNRDERTATFYSQLAFDFVLNCIFSLVYAKDRKLKIEREMRTK